MVQQEDACSCCPRQELAASRLPHRVQAQSLSSLSANREFHLVDAAIQGRPKAMDRLTNTYSSVVHMALSRLTLSSDEREDMVQEVFLHLLDDNARRLKQWRRTGRFTAYLSTLSYHLALQRLRLRKARAEVKVEHLDDRQFSDVADRRANGLYDQAWHSYVIGIIGRCLDALPGADADIIRRRYVLGETYKEIGSARSMTVTHVGVALLRADRRLRDMLRQDHPELFDA